MMPRTTARRRANAASAGHPLSPECQGPAEVLCQSPLPGSGAHRARGWQAQTLQARGPALREDRPELRCMRLSGLRLHLDQIRPQELGSSTSAGCAVLCLNIVAFGALVVVVVL